MHIIDADTHIDETDDTWEYMQGSDLQFKPTTTYPSNPDPKVPPARYWMIDGKRQIRCSRSGKDSRTSGRAGSFFLGEPRRNHTLDGRRIIQVIDPTRFVIE